MKMNPRIEWAIQEVAFKQQSSSPENVTRECRNSFNRYQSTPRPTKEQVIEYLNACSNNQVEGRNEYRHND